MVQHVLILINVKFVRKVRNFVKVGLTENFVLDRAFCNDHLTKNFRISKYRAKVCIHADFSTCLILAPACLSTTN